MLAAAGQLHHLLQCLHPIGIARARRAPAGLPRADAVKRVLVGRGVQEKQITALGMGEADPVASNGSAAGRKKNRRVVLNMDVPNPT